MDNNENSSSNVLVLLACNYSETCKRIYVNEFDDTRFKADFYSAKRKT